MARSVSPSTGEVCHKSYAGDVRIFVLEALKHPFRGGDRRLRCAAIHTAPPSRSWNALQPILRKGYTASTDITCATGFTDIDALRNEVNNTLHHDLILQDPHVSQTACFY